MEEGIWARRSQDVVLGCCKIVSLHASTGGKGRFCPASLWVISVPAQQQSINSINLKINHKKVTYARTYTYILGREEIERLIM